MIALFTKRCNIVSGYAQHTQYSGHQLQIQTHQKLLEYKLNINQSVCSQSLVRHNSGPQATNTTIILSI